MPSWLRCWVGLGLEKSHHFLAPLPMAFCQGFPFPTQELHWEEGYFLTKTSCVTWWSLSMRLQSMGKHSGLNDFEKRGGCELLNTRIYCNVVDRDPREPGVWGQVPDLPFGHKDPSKDGTKSLFLQPSSTKKSCAFNHWWGSPDIQTAE